MRTRDPAGRVLALPNQTPGLLEQAGLTRTQVDQSAWALFPDGTAVGAAAAVVATLRELPRWRWVTVLYAVPWLRWTADAFYPWFARHRGQFARWGVAPEAGDGARERESGGAGEWRVAR